MNVAVDPKIQTAGNIGEATEGLLVVVTGTVQSKLSDRFVLSDTTGTATVYIDYDSAVDISGIQVGAVVQATGGGRAVR
jgi:hypothetical protein